MILRSLFPLVLLMLLVTSCKEPDESVNQSYLVSKDVFTSRIGDKKVYGVEMKLAAEELSYVKSVIQLNINEEVWIDTISLELKSNDTLVFEKIFSGTTARDNDRVELNVKVTQLER